MMMGTEELFFNLENKENEVLVYFLNYVKN